MNSIIIILYHQVKMPIIYCHAPNPIPGSVTMTGMLISSLNLILTRTNLNFYKTFPKASLFIFRIILLFHYFLISLYTHTYIYPYLYKVISITLKEHICYIISHASYIVKTPTTINIYIYIYIYIS